MLISYSDGNLAWGVRRGEHIVSGRRLLEGRFTDLRSVISTDCLAEALGAAENVEPDIRFSDVTLLPTVPNPEHILCCGLNYAAHAAESGKEAPAAPRIFLRAASSLIGDGAPLLRPSCSTAFDFEGEIAVIIGRAGRNIAEERAMEHVAGYTCFMDGSVRDWQKITTTLGKNFAGTGALGPGLMPADAMPDWREITLVTRVNGEEVQRGVAGRMIHTIPAVLAFLSRMVELQPGDVIATGTPEGIGARRNPPLWLRPATLSRSR